ncbi:unnamed protein product [Cuscuta europaea]|uniref:Arabidopsis retrotransposon Orf1 C-terminal domain-containing protein n=2 Tax=Cuscuta europaea TaxID=41803 RepID=A0A9P1EAL8_CUSEU|nr:unnamed protein product [Cuscuta europaea]
MCLTTLVLLWIDTVMRDIFARIGISRMFEMQYVTYPHLVYEFFSSFAYTKDVNDHANDIITFRLLNEDRSLTKREFVQHFGLPWFDEARTYDSLVGYELWRRMTGKNVVDLSKLSVNRVQHPVFRLFLKFCSNCFLGRPNNHHTRIWDVCVLAQAVLPGPNQVDVATILWTHFNNVATSTGLIAMGGLITHLATLYGFIDPGPITSRHLICTEWLLQKTLDLVPSHTTPTGAHIYNWRILPHTSIYLQIPSADVPLDIINHQIGDGHHYCLPGAIPDHYEEPIHDEDDEEPPIIPEQPQPQAFHYTHFEQQMLDNMVTLNQSIVRMEEQRQADWRRYEEDRRRSEEDQRRTFGPIYSYIAHQGSFSSMTTPPPAPSWYDPSQWDFFGGSSSGGGGYDGGYGGDHMDEDGHQGGGLGGH